MKTILVGSLLFYSLTITAFVAFLSYKKEKDAPYVPSGNYMLFMNPTMVHEKSGIDVRAYGDFWEKWHLVTSRYRLDNNQTRLIYANDLAWGAMEHKSHVYPDGSVFVKAVFESDNDPVFPSSLIPTKYIETQFMVKDSNRFSETGGWGFAIFDKTDYGQLPPVAHPMAQESMKTCFSCHEIVKNRDHVFALPAFLGWYQNDVSMQENLFEGKFIETSFDRLSSAAQTILKKYRVGPFPRYKVYSLPDFHAGQKLVAAPMAVFTRKDGLPHLMLGEDRPYFILTLPAQKDDANACVPFIMTAQSKVSRGKICSDMKLIEEKTEIQ